MEIPPTSRAVLPTGPNNGHWKFPETLNTTYSGFIYVIRDNVLERFYLGKKNFKHKRGKNAGREMDWRKYRSSSSLLKELFAHRPADEFEYIVLEQYKAQGALSYAETWTLCNVEAPTSSTWYNTRIEKVSWSVKEGITRRHKSRLSDVINMREIV